MYISVPKIIQKLQFQNTALYTAAKISASPFQLIFKRQTNLAYFILINHHRLTIFKNKIYLQNIFL